MHAWQSMGYVSHLVSEDILSFSNTMRPSFASIHASYEDIYLSNAHFFMSSENLY